LGLTILTDFTHDYHRTQTLLECLNDTSVFAKFSIKLAWRRILSVDDESCVGVNLWQGREGESQEANSTALIGSVDFDNVIFVSFVIFTERDQR
jgi:hypothetical protein